MYYRNHTTEYMNVIQTEVKIINGVAVKFADILVHTFRISDVEDPEIYAAGPLFDWERSKAGQWVMAHSVKTPWWIYRLDYLSYGYEFNIVARLSEADATFFRLKYV